MWTAATTQEIRLKLTSARMHCLIYNSVCPGDTIPRKQIVTGSLARTIYVALQCNSFLCLRIRCLGPGY